MLIDESEPLDISMRGVPARFKEEATQARVVSPE